MPSPVRALLGSASGFAHTRLALLGTELREELARFAATLLGGGAAIVLGSLALAAAAAGVILAAGEHRVLASFALAALFAAAATCIALRVRAALAAKPAALGASLAELARDREALLERAAGERASFAEASGEVMRLVSIGLLAYSIGKRLRRAA